MQYFLTEAESISEGSCVSPAYDDIMSLVNSSHSHYSWYSNARPKIPEILDFFDGKEKIITKIITKIIEMWSVLEDIWIANTSTRNYSTMLTFWTQDNAYFFQNICKFLQEYIGVVTLQKFI